MKTVDGKEESPLDSKSSYRMEIRNKTAVAGQQSHFIEGWVLLDAVTEEVLQGQSKFIDVELDRLLPKLSDNSDQRLNVRLKSPPKMISRPPAILPISSSNLLTSFE